MKEKQIKSSIRYHYKPTRLPRIEKLDNIKCGEITGQGELNLLVGYINETYTRAPLHIYKNVHRGIICNITILET